MSYRCEFTKPPAPGRIQARVDAETTYFQEYTYEVLAAEIESVRQAGRDPFWHEYVHKDALRKFFVDIDYEIPHDPSEECNPARLEECLEHCKRIVNIIRRVIREITGKIAILPYWIDSTGPTPNGTKFSKNLIIPNLCFTQAAFADILLAVHAEYMKSQPISETFIDTNQRAISFNNRILGCAKYKSGKSQGRIKRIDDQPGFSYKPARPENTYLTNVAGLEEYTPNVEAREDAESIEYSDEEVTRALEFSKRYWKDAFRFTSRNGAFLRFARIAPSHCEWCDRTHDSDNTLYICLTDRGCMLVGCTRKPGNYVSMPFGVSTPKPVSQGVSQPIEKPVEISVVKPVEKPTGWITTHHFREHNPDISDMAFNDEHDVCLVKANMKMGKTKKCKEYLTRFEPSDIVVIVSFRITFGVEMASKYDGFSLYSDIKGDISLDEYPRLIIQQESLQRIQVKSGITIKCLILDEIESIWSQFSSGNYRDYVGAINVFKWLYSRAEKVIGMDAFITDRSMLLSQYLRQSKPFLYENTFTRDGSLAYEFTRNEDALFKEIQDSLGRGENIAVFTNSLKRANELTRRLSSYNTQCYSSETAPDVKREHFKDVNKYWKGYQVVICTSTITAGISFEVKDHFTTVFGLFTSHSCNAETAMQMMGRIRDYRRAVVCILKEPVLNNPTTPWDIASSLKISRSATVSMYDKYGLGQLPCSFTEDGESSYIRDFRFQLTVHNIAHDNYSKNNFYKQFRKLVRLSGVPEKHMSDLADNDPTETFNTKRYEEMRVEEIAKSPIINIDEYSAILDDPLRPYGDFIKSVRYEICRDFRIEPEKLGLEFIEKMVNSAPDLKMFKAAKSYYENPSAHKQREYERMSTRDILDNPELHSLVYSLHALGIPPSQLLMGITLDEPPTNYIRFAQHLQIDPGQDWKKIMIEGLSRILPVVVKIFRRASVRIVGASWLYLLYNGVYYVSGRSTEFLGDRPLISISADIDS